MSTKIKIITWNINSVKMRAPLIEKLILEKKPDFIFLQETKIAAECFPQIANYNYYSSGEKGKNGVAILSKPEHICEEVDFLQYQGRIKTVKFKDIFLSSLYMYNGFSLASPKIKKMELFNFMYDQLKDFPHKYILGGDFNILYKLNEATISNPYEQDEIDVFKKFETLFLDTTPKTEFITWWDYRTPFFWNQGFGLDKFFLKNLVEFENVQILKKYRNAEKPSDHAPVEITITI